MNSRRRRFWFFSWFENSVACCDLELAVSRHQIRLRSPSEMAILPMIFLILVKPNRGNEVISTSQGRNVDFARVQMNTRKFRSVGMKRGGYGKAAFTTKLKERRCAADFACY